MQPSTAVCCRYLCRLSFLMQKKEKKKKNQFLTLIIHSSKNLYIQCFWLKVTVNNELTRLSSSILALMTEYIATPAMAIAVPIPVCVDILFPGN